jgi:stress response protein SCP2
MNQSILKTLAPLALLYALFLSACGSSNGVDFGAPSISTIVDSATPSSLKTATAYNPFKTFFERYLSPTSATAASSTCSAAGNVSSGCATAAEYLSFLRSEVFTKSTSTNVAATLYFRYWVDVLDNAMTSTNSRLKTNSVTPACVSQTAVTVDFTFNVNGTAVTVSPKLQCWETQSGVGAGTQNMAFGKDSSYFYLVYRTNDNATTSGSGIRIVIAKASLDGTTADIWFVGASYQQPSGGGAVERRGNVQRVLANKTTGAFTFNTVEEDDTAKGYLFGSFYAHTDGTKVAMEAAYGSGTTLTDVTSMTRAVPYCANLSALTTNLGAASCSTLNGTSPPTGFGLTTAMTNSTAGSATLWQANTAAETAFETAIDTITAIDYTAKGVGKFEAAN